MHFAAVACLAALALQASPRADLRLHHVHVRVADPAMASREASRTLAATRTMLQGHGIAVRAGSEYVVFDREDEALLAGGDSRLYGPLYAGAVYRQATSWLARQGLTATPDELRAGTMNGAIPANRIDRVAFAAAEPARVIERLSAAGVSPLERTPEAARYRLSPELVVEIIGETERPDTHWCPMHPDIRAGGVGRCPLCGMDLVPIPPPRIGEYRLKASVRPADHDRASVRVTLQVADPETSDPVTSFLDLHEKPFHLFIVSRDLDQFAHVHPEQQRDGSFAIEQRLPPGEYVLIADFLPAAGTPQMVQRTIVTPGYRGPLFAPAPTLATTPLERVVDGLHVKLEAANLLALRPAVLRFALTDATTGAAVEDLEPYLGAAGHLLVVDEALRRPVHAHPDSTSSGAAVTFDPVLPVPGRYKLWVQFQRKGRVITVPFVIDVAGE